jgi:hypothetical protein
MSTIGDIKIGRVNQNLPNYISIRCDRKTVLGNPFFMHNESMRDEVCNKFEAYLPQAFNTDYAVAKAIGLITGHVSQGNNVLLQCWCAPKRCHCDSIKSFVLNLIKE